MRSNIDQETNKWSEYSKLVLELLEQHSSQIRDQNEVLSTQNKSLTVLHTQLLKVQLNQEQASHDIASLLKIVRDGNGSSLLSRVQSTEKDVSLLKEDKVEQDKNAKTLINHKRGLITAMVAAVASLVIEGIKFFAGWH